MYLALLRKTFAYALGAKRFIAERLEPLVDGWIEDQGN